MKRWQGREDDHKREELITRGGTKTKMLCVFISIVTTQVAARGRVRLENVDGC